MEDTALPTPEQLAGMLRFYTPLVSDTMERMGLESTALDSSIQQTLPNPAQRVCGLAFPCRVIPTEEYVEIDTLLEMIDAIPTGAFVIVASDAPIDAALWGGMMSARAGARGAVGAAVNGGVRDIEQIARLNFPVFGTGRCIRDIRRRGYMTAYNVPVRCGSVEIAPGDVILADANGVISIPQRHFAALYHELDRAYNEEQATEEGLRSGAEARTLFDRYGRF